MPRALTRLFPAVLLLLLTPALSLAQESAVSLLLNPEGSRLFPDFFIAPRHPGKPDLRWRVFDWKYVDGSALGSPYRLYFYDEESWTASYAIPQIEKQIERLSAVFKETPKTPFAYLLFSSQRDFQQAHIFNISEGVQGITSTTEATMAIPYWGEAETFRHISQHEMTHQFQVQKCNRLTDDFAQEAMAGAPLWFIEGMAEYYSLNGIDAETRSYIRDALVNPRGDLDHKAPGFFEDGELNFIQVYKFGQTKIGFLEDLKFGSTQEILQRLCKDFKEKNFSFSRITSTVIGLSPKLIEERWKAHLKADFQNEADHLSQSMDQFEVVPNSEDTLDSFSVSPSGDMIAQREIDPITGITSIQILDATRKYEKTEVIHDFSTEAISLYFMQRPGMDISQHWVAFLAETVAGPQLILRRILRKDNAGIGFGEMIKIKINSLGISQAASPAISSDEKQIAFVGVDPQGRQNVYTLFIEASGRSALIRQLTQGSYSWRNLNWNDGGILAASDQTPGARYNLFLLNPDTGVTRQLSYSTEDQLWPENSKEGIFFQSWESGTAQIHLLKDGKETRLTDVKTQILSPVSRGDRLYALGFRGSRFHLYQIPKKQRLAIQVETPEPTPNQKWTPLFRELGPSIVHSYRPFFSSGTRTDYILGAVGTGGILSAVGAFSDLMRNYQLDVGLGAIRGLGVTNANIFLSSSIGRTRWTLGPYHYVRSSLDNTFSVADGQIRTFLTRETGILGALEYPFAAFSFADAELRIGNAGRNSFSDPNLAPQWEAIKPPSELVLTPIFRLGYDTILYELFSGPISGFGILGESETGYYPSRKALSERVRLDAAYYWRLFSTSVMGFHAMGGASWGDSFRESFFISSDDILRGYRLLDERLYGNYFVAGNAELHFPIGTFFGFPPLRGLVAYDLGSVFLSSRQLSSHIASSYSSGLTFNFPPISLNMILSRPLRVYSSPQDSSVFHFTLRYLYL